MRQVLAVCLLAVAAIVHGNAHADAPERTTLPVIQSETTEMTSETRASETPSVRQVSLPNLPTELKFDALDKSWRRFTIRNSGNDRMAVMYGNWGPQYEQVLNDIGIGVHFTKGDNLSLGNESYLIAYRVDPGLEPQDLQQEIQQRMQAFWGHGQQQPPIRPQGKFAPGARLKLSLLNLRNAGNLEDLRTFDPQRDLMSPKDLRELSNYNLRRLGQVMQQTSRWQGLQLRDFQQLRQMMRNQHAPVSLLRNPADNETYHLNTALAGKKPEQIGNRKSVVVVYEAAPASDNTRGVLFLDWHVERVPEWKWQSVRNVKPKGPSPKELRVISANQMKQIFRQMQNWARSNRRLPTTTDANAARRELMSWYGWNQPLYQEPAKRQWYRFNPKIARLNLNEITNKNQVVALYEPNLGGDGKRGAIFLDGIVRRVDDAKWKAAIAVKPRMK